MTSRTSGTAGALDTGTWHRERSCATWLFELALPPGAPTAAAIATCARGMLAALPGFAVPAVADWSTASGGDEVVVQARGTTMDDARVAETLRAHPDLIALALDLDLQVLAPDGVTEVTVEDGAVLHIELDGELLVLWLSLHVDLYARRSFGANRDNAQLARLNAPRLTGFLARLVDATGARFHSVDAAGYDDQATQHGFL